MNSETRVVEFTSSFSPTLGRAFNAATEDEQQKLLSTISDLAQDIDSKPELVASLKRDSIAGLYYGVRRVDIMKSKTEILLKTYSYWDHTRKRLHMMVEGPTETFWEDHHHEVGNG